MKKAKPGERVAAKKNRSVSGKKTARNQAAKKSTAKKKAAPRKTSPRKTAAKKSASKRAAPKTVAEYLAVIPEPTRSAVNQIRAAIRSVVPEEATEVISYGIPAFRHKTVLVWYAGFSSHCSLFPTAAIIDEFKDELQGYSKSKGTIHFPTDKAIPLELIKKIVTARVEQSKR